ncbi:Detected protein of unknown function [Hibiscus syriacus]|uniref:Uncharacterized protein n=1 Tax=Hibiscus syriacus TaxID=106335 RepID=A0A6A3CA17_HIBSY|nr:Detected protein of unknown function [Hibiscus syriacus]
MPFYEPDKQAAGASYYSHFPEPFSYPAKHDMTRHGLYRLTHNPNHIPPYGDPFGSQMLGRAPHQLPGEYPQRPPHPYFSGQYIESNHDAFMPYPQSSVLHQASCSCFHCFEEHRRVSTFIPASSFGNKRFPDVSCNPMYHIENPGTFGSYFHRKVQLNAKYEKKLRCGACSSVINFTVTNKKLVLHDRAETKGSSVEVDDISDELSMDGEPVASSAGRALNSIRPQEMRSFNSSPSISEDDNSSDVLIASREEAKFVRQPTKSTVSPPPGDSPLQEYFDYSSGNHAANRFGKGNCSNRCDQEKYVSNKATTRQNSLKEVSLPSEMEIRYDFRAGFWGVLGGPCLGIIPPFIEEFNYPMPENCAGGTTGVFVNGRELHRKDLNLLSNRGLPTDRDRSYIIEISGRVLDEDTGEEQDCLGNLAHT